MAESSVHVHGFELSNVEASNCEDGMRMFGNTWAFGTGGSSKAKIDLWVFH